MSLLCLSCVYKILRVGSCAFLYKGHSDAGAWHPVHNVSKVCGSGLLSRSADAGSVHCLCVGHNQVVQLQAWNLAVDSLFLNDLHLCLSHHGRALKHLFKPLDHCVQVRSVVGADIEAGLCRLRHNVSRSSSAAYDCVVHLHIVRHVLPQELDSLEC